MDDYKDYILAELSYKKEHPELSEEELFPLIWDESRDYKLKTYIIMKAIENKKLITEIEEFESI